jgi:hypothetical protein
MKSGDKMKNQPYVPLKATAFFPKPLMRTNIETKQQFLIICPKQVASHEFFVISDGKKRVFLDEDGLIAYGRQKILNPLTVSYINLFINGILQPKMNYKVEEGKFNLLTEDIPTEGTPIILQMITYY